MVNDEVAAFHTSAAERLFNAASVAPSEVDAEKILLLIVESVFPSDDEAFKMFALAVVTCVPKVLDAERTFALVVTMFAFAVAREFPRDVELLAT